MEKDPKWPYHTNDWEELYKLDMISVVRCKDCMHSYEDIGGRYCSYGVCVDCEVKDDFFCANGVRNERD